MAVTRYCPNCGLERREGERFCRNCGHALGTGQTKLHESPVATTAPLAASSSASSAAEQAAGVPSSAPNAPTTPAPEAPPSALPPPPQPVVRAPRAPIRIPPFKPVALAGGVVILVGVFLPWISGGLSLSGLDVPLEAVWNIDAGDSALKLGYAFLVLGTASAALSFVGRSVRIRRILGSLALALVLGFALQLYRSIDQAGGSFGDVISTIGIGVYVTVVGAICLQLSK